MTSKVFIAKYLSGSLPKFDAMVTYSSIEHSGLGRSSSRCVKGHYLSFYTFYRYEDGLHPWGDLVTMAKAYCVLKENALVLVGIPLGKESTLVFNAHR